MEKAVARQFARNEKVLVVRNGWFSYRWTQIFDRIFPNKPDVYGVQDQSLPKGLEIVCAPLWGMYF